MSTIKSDLQNSGQAFIYVFVPPTAKLTPDIMGKRAEQLSRLSEMYAQDSSYTPAQMIDILRAGIVAKYGHEPEELLKVMYNIAIWTNKPKPKESGVGDLPVDSNLMTDKYGNLVDITGNVLVWNTNTNTKIDFSSDPKTYISQESGKPFQSVSEISFPNSSNSKSTFWDDVKNVIDVIIGWLSKLGVTNAANKTASYSPHYGDYNGLTSQAGIGSGLTTYLPYIAAAGIIYYLATDKGAKSKKIKALQQ